MAEEDGGVAEGGGAGRERDGAADGELPHPLLAVSVQATGARPAVSSPFADRLVCINDRAVWNLSGAKPGNGVDELLDGDPHLLTLRFYKRETVLGIALYLDYSQDESYTPKALSLRAGHILHNLRSMREVTLDEPVGWVWIPLWDADLEGPRPRPLRVHLLQLAITAMHQHGRDTHVRQVMIFGPLEPVLGVAAPQAPLRTSGGAAADFVHEERWKSARGESAIR